MAYFSFCVKAKISKVVILGFGEIPMKKFQADRYIQQGHYA